jgi:hypothetical protein
LTLWPVKGGKISILLFHHLEKVRWRFSPAKGCAFEDNLTITLYSLGELRADLPLVVAIKMKTSSEQDIDKQIKQNVYQLRAKNQRRDIPFHPHAQREYPHLFADAGFPLMLLKPVFPLRIERRLLVDPLLFVTGSA